MKRDTRQKYLAALKEHSRVKCKRGGELFPIVVDAFRFFDEACERAGMPHTFTTGSKKKILDMFDEPFRQVCHTDDEGFPITVLKMPRNVIWGDKEHRGVGHGRLASFDAKLTKERYRELATIKSDNPYEGWALFGPLVPRDHPIVNASFGVAQKHLSTLGVNFNKRVAAVAPDMMVELSKPATGVVRSIDT